MNEGTAHEFLNVTCESVAHKYHSLYLKQGKQVKTQKFNF